MGKNIDTHDSMSCPLIPQPLEMSFHCLILFHDQDLCPRAPDGEVNAQPDPGGRKDRLDTLPRVRTSRKDGPLDAQR